MVSCPLVTDTFSSRLRKAGQHVSWRLWTAQDLGSGLGLATTGLCDLEEGPAFLGLTFSSEKWEAEQTVWKDSRLRCPILCQAVKYFCSSTPAFSMGMLT